MGDHLLAATPPPDMGASQPTVASTNRIEAGASCLLESSEVSAMHEMTVGDLDRLAVALARLLAAYWCRQTSTDMLGNGVQIHGGDGVPATDARAPHLD